MSDNDVAVIGMAGRFPGAPDVASLWRNLRAGIESISRFAPSELERSPVGPPLDPAHPDFVPAGGVIEGADAFDHSFFGLSRREAQWLDPQQRVLLQAAWAALEDAGYDPARGPDRISVYAGAGNSGHLLRLLGRLGPDPASQYEALTAGTSENAATKISYQLGLRGESITVHTACSTGLAAVHLACQSLLLGQSQLALAGAVRLAVPQRTGYRYQPGMILSRDGHCRAFDADASGTVPGNGVGVVVLKPLADALADRDRVYAVIAGSALNNDGHRGVGYTAPSVAGQAEVIAEALAFAEVGAGEIGYVEAHGTGTPLGDPIEIAALTRAFRRSTDRRGDCPIGSVKTNLGHLDTAAGIAGLIKVALMLHHRELPPSLHLATPNPAIEFAESPFTVNTALRPWPAVGDRPRRAGVSSFGIGGTNVHAVLAQAPPAPPTTPSSRPYQLVTLAARTPAALATMAAELADRLDDQTPLADLAYTRAVGRAEFAHRQTFVVQTVEELAGALRDGTPRGGTPRSSDPRGGAPAGSPAPIEPCVVFLFPGQGAARHAMAGQLYLAEPDFRAALDRAVAALEPSLGQPLLPVLREGSGPIDDPALAHPALFALEYALATLWRGWGIEPAALLGHSFGEYAAACVAGRLSLAEIAPLVVTRGRLVGKLPAGAMLAVGAAPATLRQRLADAPELSLAAVNGDHRCVVSGPVEAVTRLQQQLAAAKLPAVRLPVGYAFHSPAVEPVLAALTEAAAGCHAGEGELPLLSSLTGDWLPAGEPAPGYWARQMREPVRFGAALDRLVSLPAESQRLIVVEVGPDQALTTLARDQLRGRATAVPSLRAARAGTADHRVLLTGLATLWRAGAPVDWAGYYRPEQRRRVPLPTYPFEEVDCRLAPAGPAAPDQPAPATPIMELWHDPPADPPPEVYDQHEEAGEARADGPRDELERQIAALWQERLGTDEFGVHDSFLELGGNSLIAAQLLTRLREVFEVPLPLSALFDSPTVAGIAEAVRALTGSQTGAAAAPAAATPLPPITPRPREGALPLSVVQERTLTLAAADPANPALAMPVAIAIDGELSIPDLAAAISAVVARHEALRTTFHPHPGGWRAEVAPAAEVPLPCQEVDDQAAAQQLARTEPTIPFDLTRTPIRARLLKLGADRHILLLTVHHVVSDTLSMVILVPEIAAAYRARLAGEPVGWAPLPVQYADFAGWQRELLAGNGLTRQCGYWRDQLAPAPRRLPLPTDAPLAREAGARGGQRDVSLPPELSQQLTTLSQRLGVTPFVTLLAGYAALLGRVSGATELVIGTPVANRDSPELAGLIGYVAHAVPLRADLRGDPRFATLVGQLQQTVLAAFSHPDLPYEALAEVGAGRLFDAVLVLHADLPEQQSVPGLTWRRWPVPGAPAMFGATLGRLTLMLAGSPAGFSGSLGYADELFTPATADRLFGQFQRLLADAVARPETRLSQLRLGGPAAPTPMPASATSPAWQGLLTAARQRPDQPALTTPERRWSWRELAESTDPAGPGLVGQLAALRAGTALPLPQRRWPAAAVTAGLAGWTAALGDQVATLVALSPPATDLAALDLVWALATGRPVRVLDAALPGWLPAAERRPGALQLSLSYFANDEDAVVGPKYALLREGAQLADALGFTAIWTPERHFHSFGGLYPNPTAVSAALAAATHRISVRAGSVVLPLHDPIRVAEDWSVIDNLSGGRVGVSFASGWHPDDFVLAPDGYARRRETMAEGIETVRRLWRGEPVTRTNGVGAPVEVRIRPRPVQPELPFWLTAAGNPATFVAAGQAGGYLLTNLMAQTLDDLAGKIDQYRRAWRAAGHPGEGHVTLMLHAFLAETTDQAYAVVRDPLLRYFRSSVDILRGFAAAQGRTVHPEDLSEADMQALLEHGLERYLQTGGLFGTPDDCAPLLARVRALGVDEVAALIDYGTPTTETLASVRRLGELITRERARADAAAQAGAAQVTAEVARLAEQVEAAGDAALQLTPAEWGWLAEHAPASLAGRPLLLATAPTGEADEAGPIFVPAPGRVPGGRVRWCGGPADAPELVARPAPGAAAQVCDPAGEPLAVGVAGELTLAGEPTGAPARWRPTGELDLLPGAVHRPAPIPLSFAQQRIWSLEQLVPGNLAYHNAVALRLRGPLDRAALHRALREVVARHEVLRTTVHPTGDGAVQVVHREVAIPLPVSDADPAEVAARARAHAREPFSLSTGPLLRARLLRLADDHHVLLICMHHLVSDGWSAGVLFTELGTLYAHYRTGAGGSPLAPLTWQYPEYARWQRSQPELALAGQLDYWRAALADLPLLELPTDRPRGPVQSPHGARYPVALDRVLTDALGTLGRRTGTTPFMVLLAGFTALLHRYTGQRDLPIGTAVAGRTRPETEALVGCFINTLVIRADLTGEPTFGQLLERVKEQVLAALAHQDVPFERLVDELRVPRDLSHAPLCQAMLVLHNTPSPQLALGELTLTGMDVDAGTAKLDLTLELREGPDGITGAFEYNTDLFDQPTIAGLAEHLVALLTAAAAEPERRLGALALLAPPEQLTHSAGEALPAAPAGGPLAEPTVAAGFDLQAARTPAAVAVGDPDRPLTYRELAEAANQLAHGLAAHGVGPGCRVVLLIEPAVEAIPAMLAVLKAGGAYVPLDPHAPPDRLAALVAQADPVLVLAAGPAGDLDPPVRHPATLRAGQPTDPPPPTAGPTDPAYVIFTSGSTGKPKGVVVEHRQLLASTRARAHHYGAEAGSCLCLYPLSFDGSVGWIFYPLLSGGTLWCPAGQLRTDPAGLAALIHEHALQRIAGVSGLYGQLLAAARPPQLDSLHSATVGGDACPPELVRAHTVALPGTALHNEYGPTEVTVNCTAYRIDRYQGDRVPVGRPIAGARTYLLDAYQQPVPAGAAGELYVGGPTLARGYLGEPALTSQRFVPDPHHPGERLYRTGDRFRWNHRGELEFLGRLDRQVKIRGFRVEPAEVEAVLVSHPSVTEAAVVAAGHRLVGYLANNGAPVPVDEVRAHAAARLPEYLLPAALVPVPALPRNRHGKLDLIALPSPEPADRRWQPPTDGPEQALAEVLAGVLDLDPGSVGRHDNFFDLGGDSILAINLVTRAREQGVTLTVRQVFQNPTVARLAAVAGTALAVPVSQRPVTGPAVLSPIQRWFFGMRQPHPEHWQMAVPLRLAAPVAADALAAAFRAVLTHHDALRLRFVPDPAAPGGWRAFHAETEADWRLRRIDLAAVPPDRRAAELARRAEQRYADTSLADGPLLRSALLSYGGDTPPDLLVWAHHLVTDGVSWRIILSDLFTAYQQLVDGEPVHLPAKTSGYQQWAQALSGYPDSAAGRAAREFFAGQPYRLAPRLPQPAGGPATEATTATHRVQLDRQTTAALRRGDLLAALLTAVGQALSGWAGGEHLQLDLERHGRQELVPGLDLSRTVGWFSDFHPLLLPVPAAASPADRLAAATEALRAVPQHGAGFVPLQYGGPRPALPDLPRSEVTVNYLGQLDSLLPPDAPATVAGEIPGRLRAPSTRQPYLIEVTAGILAGELFLVWSYPAAGYPTGTVTRLANTTLRELGRLAQLLD